MTVASPGHTPGHTAYYAPSRRILFAGDAVVGSPSKLEVSVKEYTFSQSLALISLRRLAHLDVETVIMYHGTPVLRGAAPLLKAAASEGYGEVPQN